MQCATIADGLLYLDTIYHPHFISPLHNIDVMSPMWPIEHRIGSAIHVFATNTIIYMYMYMYMYTYVRTSACTYVQFVCHVFLLRVCQPCANVWPSKNRTSSTRISCNIGTISLCEKSVDRQIRTQVVSPGAYGVWRQLFQISGERQVPPLPPPSPLRAPMVPQALFLNFVSHTHMDMHAYLQHWPAIQIK